MNTTRIIAIQSRAAFYASLAMGFRDDGNIEYAIDAQNEAAKLYAEARAAMGVY